jgi:microcystin-dependent protein
MSEPFIGEIRLFAGNFAPRDWAFCEGQLISIAQNTALFALLGTTYGGNGQTTFALPDLRGRVPMHMGQGPGLSGHTQGEVAGTEQVTLLATQMPPHSHALRASTAAASGSTPAGALLGATSVNSYDNTAAGTAMATVAIGSSGGAQPHQNMAPTMVLSYIIALAGIFPSRN